jgi:hypothetical protein
LIDLLDRAVTEEDDAELRARLVEDSRLPGPRLNLQLVAEFADAVGRVVSGPEARVTGDRLATMLDGWAALSPAAAPGDRPEVILPCAAAVAYGEAAAVRPEWWDHEAAKLRRVAGDSRWRVREAVTMGLQRMLAADWERGAGLLREWAADRDPLVVRAAAAGVAEPPLLHGEERVAAAMDVQRRAVHRLRSYPEEVRRTDSVRTLRQALGFTVAVVVAAAAGDFGLLDSMATSGDPDLQWAVKENLKKARLRPWPADIERLRRLLSPREPDSRK